MLLIVNADDLGATDAINEHVFALMREGLVTSASLMANAPAFEAAARESGSLPGASFGVHLNATVFQPLRPSPALAPILDEDGSLSRRLFHARLTPAVRTALLREWSAQVERVLQAGVKVSHLDSHHHVHTLPALLPVLKAVQRRFGIRRARSTISLLRPGEKMTPLRRLRKRVFCFVLDRAYTTRAPSGLGDFRVFLEHLQAGSLNRQRCLELMVHPGTQNPEYEREIELLRSSWRSRLPPWVRLGSYLDL